MEVFICIIPAVIVLLVLIIFLFYHQGKHHYAEDRDVTTDGTVIDIQHHGPKDQGSTLKTLFFGQVEDIIRYKYKYEGKTYTASEAFTFLIGRRPLFVPFRVGSKIKVRTYSGTPENAIIDAFSLKKLIIIVLIVALLISAPLLIQFSHAGA